MRPDWLIPLTLARWLKSPARFARCCAGVAGLCLLVGANGCTDLSRSTVQAVKTVWHGSGARPIAAEVAARPYYQLQATSADGVAVLILGNLDGTREAWYGSHQVAVFIEHGRVVKTTGLRENLAGLQLPVDDPFARGLQTLAAPVDYDRREDWSPGYRYGVLVRAQLVPAGATTIDILGVPHAVLRVDEHVRADGANYDVTNHYWVDPHNGFVWKSEQHVAPGIVLQLVQLKPYRGVAP